MNIPSPHFYRQFRFVVAIIALFSAMGIMEDAASTTPDPCLMGQLRQSDKNLNLLYERTMAASSDQERIILMKLQRSWIKERDGACHITPDNHSKNWISSLAADENKARCVLEQTKIRSAALKKSCMLSANNANDCQLPHLNERISEACLPKVSISCNPNDNSSSCAPGEKLRPPCGFSEGTLPKEYALFAAGGYSGYKLSFQIDSSGKEASQMDITVNHPNKPVVLILGAYDPTIWNLNWTPGTTLAAIYVTGYKTQFIAGVSKNTPILISTYENKHPCGYIYITQEHLAKINPLAMRLFGRNVDRVYLADNGKVLVGEPLDRDTPLLNDPEHTPASYRLANTPLSGQAGLIEAVNRGELRPATPEDKEDWLRLMRESQQHDSNLPPTEGLKQRDIIFHNSFVVLKPFTFPAGLYGGNLATFLVPKGVPIPKGNPGHSAIYDFNSKGCIGSICSIQ